MALKVIVCLIMEIYFPNFWMYFPLHSFSKIPIEVFLKYVFHNMHISTHVPHLLSKDLKSWRLNYNRFANAHSHDFPSVFNTRYISSSINPLFLAVNEPVWKTKLAACRWDQHCCYNMSYIIQIKSGRNNTLGLFSLVCVHNIIHFRVAT